jgi:hypothetical protein
MCHRSCVRCVSGRLKMGVLCVMNSSLSVRLFLLLALIDLYTLHFPICHDMQVSSIRPPERNNILADGSEKHAQASESAAPFCWTY